MASLIGLLLLLGLFAETASASSPPSDGAHFLQSQEFTDEFGFVEVGGTGSRADNGMSVVFANLLDVTIAMFWDDGTPEGRPQGFIPAKSVTNSGTYPGHVFWFKRAGKGRHPAQSGGPKLVSHLITEKQDFYLIHDGKAETLESEHGKFRTRQDEFMKEYRTRTGLSWLTDYDQQHGPRGMPVNGYWPAAHVNQRHRVPWGDPPAAGALSSFWGSTGGTIDMVVLSVTPKVFLLPDLLTTAECDLIKELATPKLGRSTIGAGSVAHEDNTRQSHTAWLSPRNHKTLKDTIYKKYSALFPCINHEFTCAEDMQIVRYQKVGDEYTGHFDFFNTGEGKNRFATLLVYLNDPPIVNSSAGGTGFPKAFGGRGLNLRPHAGSAVLFYNLLEDGNGDRLSEHAGLPVPDCARLGTCSDTNGEKWIANVWMWDPSYSRSKIDKPMASNHKEL